MRGGEEARLGEERKRRKNETRRNGARERERDGGSTVIRVTNFPLTPFASLCSTVWTRLIINTHIRFWKTRLGAGRHFFFFFFFSNPPHNGYLLFLAVSSRFPLELPAFVPLFSTRSHVTLWPVDYLESIIIDLIRSISTELSCFSRGSSLGGNLILHEFRIRVCKRFVAMYRESFHDTIFRQFIFDHANQDHALPHSIIFR